MAEPKNSIIHCFKHAEKRKTQFTKLAPDMERWLTSVLQTQNTTAQHKSHQTKNHTKGLSFRAIFSLHVIRCVGVSKCSELVETCAPPNRSRLAECVQKQINSL